ncbi:agamous-like MADS-box protein AGL61 [Pyrus ussuriensis x Pyrus communis]|uniref:Agamous-like MADS-box protein AGL61 n=1 Tax=Pyrus ussuriensis x Pyrus communis TaxID=2448454 RepID=A0A5N5G6S4_9ROSA|nr:agamous-like MADS-box protein AGL61 [Pyrus ussuriensis x Pyrus communis]
MGRVKIEIKKITNKNYLKATYSKRRKGLCGKATDLSRLTGCQIAIIVFSPGSRLFLFGHPSAETVIDRFLAQQAPCTDNDHEDESFESIHGVDDREDLENNQEEYKQEEDEMKDAKVNFWWDELVGEQLELHELIQYKTLLNKLRENVARKLQDMNRRELCTIDFFWKEHIHRC